MLPCADIGQLSTRVCVIESYPLLQVELHIYGSSLHRIRVLHVLRPADLLMAGGSTTTMLSADSSIFNAHITARAALSFVADLSQTTHDSEASRGKHSMLPCTTAAFTSMDEPIGFAVWCQLTSPCRPFMRFLSIGSQVSHSLPSHLASRQRSWPLVIVLCIFMIWFLL